ncbi:nicotinate-nucleotide adenylyltransferase [Piscinibacter sp.]|uniref:nicotinate-nucleotide adenylyltransferase n=1 Tax=Piscinibacter sp. TaxID=1903157 RepID=UPI002BCFAC0A|nr:nicotinate-nucleotide adenylyltransferase [Albitalea sp.]HUG21942.1 nicotinate-nucleotide adenylyltransferase [Albitalea sp.]
MKRIGLFGGGFDPVHNAHVALARAALDHLRLDEVRWVPVGQAWQKPRQMAPAGDREAMVALAIRDEPRFVLERCELQRSGPSYTVDTVRELQAREQAQWFLIIGQDQYGQLHTWHDWPDLIRRVTLAVAGREGAAIVPSAELAAAPHAAVTIPLPRIDVSSTELRERIADGRDYTDMVPDAVARYIDQHHLYRGNPRS